MCCFHGNSPHRNAPNSHHHYTSSLHRNAPILTSMMQGVLHQFNLEFVEDHGILQEDDSGLQDKFWLRTACRVKNIHEIGVVTKLE